jgi:hypothetical protein
MNWYRGFYRLWLALSLLWVVAAGGTAAYITWEEYAFERRVAAARAKVQAEHPGPENVALLGPNGDFCQEPTPPPDYGTQCSADPTPPHREAEIVGWWAAVFAVPALFYGLLRTLAWILGGFGRTA